MSERSASKVAGFYSATRPQNAATPWPTIAPPLQDHREVNPRRTRRRLVFEACDPGHVQELNLSRPVRDIVLRVDGELDIVAEAILRNGRPWRPCTPIPK